MTLIAQASEEAYPVKNSIIKKSLIVLFWLIVWELLALLINNDIVFVGPIKVLKAFIGNIFYEDFLKTAGFSLLRISLGFFAAFLMGIILGALSYRWPLIKDIFSPFVTALKTVPVASFVVLLLIWFGSGRLSFFISFIIAFPIVYTATISGLAAVSKKYIELSKDYDMGLLKSVRFLYMPSVEPFLKTAIKTGASLSWKSGIAAEVIGMSGYSLGERIYISKVYLDTAGLLAWTLLVIILSFLFEKAVIFAFSKLMNMKVSLKKGNPKKDYEDISAVKYAFEYKNISVKYDDKAVLEDYELRLETGNIYCLMGPSGIGKTTLLKEIYHRTKARCAFMYQENRLFEDTGALNNILLGAEKNGFELKEAEKLLMQFLQGEDYETPVKNFSGGMKRRVSFIRTLLYKGDVILLDEPFSGIDKERREDMLRYIENLKENHIILLATHDIEDAKRLNAHIIQL